MPLACLRCSTATATAIRRLAHVSAFGNDKEIIAGPVVSEVDVETAHGIVTSVITSRSIQDRGLKVGSEVIALVKSTEVSIAKVQ
jgi:molybdopterin-binding protein